MISFFLLSPLLMNAQDSEEEGKDRSYAVRFSPLRMFTGTFQMEYEQQVADRFALNFMGMGSYLSKKGLGSWYLGSLGRERFSDMDKEGGPIYNPKALSGLGLIVQGRQYYYEHDHAPKGLYVGPTVMYRNMNLLVERRNELSNVQIEEEKQRSLGIFKVGIITGAQLPIVSKNFVFDAYGGAVFRVSSYGDETGLSDYKAWTALDHTGVTFTLGLSIGIVKHRSSGTSTGAGEGEPKSGPGEL